MCSDPNAGTIMNNKVVGVYDSIFPVSKKDYGKIKFKNNIYIRYKIGVEYSIYLSSKKLKN